MQLLQGRQSLWFWAGLVLILGYFFYFAGDGLSAGFFPDLMMNISGALERPVPRLLLDLVWPDDSAYRPVGALAYRGLYQAFGLVPAPYRIACFVLLAGNLLLAGWLTRLLSGSRWAALWAMALFSYHAYLSDLYYSSATLYDLLCGTFGIAYLALYAHWRGNGSTIRPWHSLALVCLLLGAIGSKELGLLLPLCLLLFEACFLGVWPRPHVKTLVPLGLCVLTGLFSAVARFAITTTFGRNPAYQVGLSAERVIGNLQHYGGMLFYLHRDLTHRDLAYCALAAVLLTVLARSRQAVLCLVLFFLLLAPVLVIEPRSLYVIYVPFVFLCAFLAIVLHRVTCLRCCPERVMGPLLLAALLSGLAPLHAYRKPFGNAWIRNDESQVDTILDQFHRACPALPHAARLYINSDSIPEDDYLLTFTLRLLYHDRDLEVLRRKQIHHCPTQEEWSGYTRAFDFEGWRLKEIRNRAEACKEGAGATSTPAH
ncbi:hypothetical protein [Paludibaculum fermentans]|uniref:Glycosyltransferase RgtA/B/C/D-like domain-containing protein n=1 Tax=Paludibaculum fermentans TaxID=1473598 RepID=A0A7S7NUU1_PALFE|nr:hypothetical protein [Paludibaculum fermentans]QOY89609.1 hypothetical protein IRI77_06565 [Paludibaculum fermentans]